MLGAAPLHALTLTGACFIGVLVTALLRVVADLPELSSQAITPIPVAQNMAGAV